MKTKKPKISIIVPVYNMEELLADCINSILCQTYEDYELIWVRNSGTVCDVPDGYDFIGYDISYPCDYSGSFSIICDCMFICRWHGCDIEGTLFLPEFNKLNANGLFNDWQSAYDYMVKYLNEDWTERGEYCILEIFVNTTQSCNFSKPTKFTAIFCSLVC